MYSIEHVLRYKKYSSLYELPNKLTNLHIPNILFYKYLATHPSVSECYNLFTSTKFHYKLYRLDKIIKLQQNL